MFKFRKLANFNNSTICKIIKIPKISNLVNYHVCILTVRTILRNEKIQNKFENKKIE